MSSRTLLIEGDPACHRRKGNSLRGETRHSRYPNRILKPPNKQKQARWGEAAQFEFRGQAGGRGNAGVRFSGGASVSPNVHA